MDPTTKEDHPRKRGRQALPPGEKKKEVTIRLAPNSLANLKLAAEREGLDFQKWVRKVLTERAKSILGITD